MYRVKKIIFLLSFAAATCYATEPKPEDKDLKPGSLSKKVVATATAIKTKNTFFERIKELEKLDKAVEADAEKSTVEGIRYSNALSPIMKNRKELSDKRNCAKVKSEMDSVFTSGTGFSGKLKYYQKDALQLLSVICADPALAKTLYD